MSGVPAHAAEPGTEAAANVPDLTTGAPDPIVLLPSADATGTAPEQVFPQGEMSSAAISALGTVVSSPPVRIEQTDPSFAFTGTWSTWASPLLSGGSYAYSNASGSAFTVTFVGTRLDLVCRTGPEFGIANVSVDGEEPQPVDLYSSTTRYQQVVRSFDDLASGPHTLTLSHTGTHGSASTGAYVGIDAVETMLTSVVPMTGATVVEQDDGLAFTGTWSTWASPLLSGGSYAYSNVSGSAVTVTFVGTRLDLVCRTGPEFGIANVSVDGEEPQPVDLYSSTTRYQQTVYSTGDLSAETHTVRIAFTDTGNASSTGTYVCVDALAIAGSLTAAPMRIEQTDVSFAFTGVWSTWASPALSGGSYAYSTLSGSAVTVTFVGTRLDLLFRTGPEFGIANVSIDGEAPQPVDLYSPTTLYQQTVYSTRDVPAGTHTVRISATGTRNVSSAGTYVCVDAALATKAGRPALEGAATIEESSVRACYVTRWSSWSNPSVSGGTYRYANNARASVCLSFDGTRLDLVCRTGPEFGIAKVTVDGRAVAYVDLYSPNTEYRKTVYSAWGLKPGKHSVVIAWTGRRNPVATGTYINVDAALVVESAAPAAGAMARLEESDPLVYYAGLWSGWSSDVLSGGSYRYAHSAGSTVMSSFQGTRFGLICRTGPEFGIAKVTVDDHLSMLVDLYSEETAYKQEVLTVWGLPSGMHTVKVGWTGTRNAAASDTYIGIDAVDIDGPEQSVTASERALLPVPVRIYLDAGHGGSDPGAIDGTSNDAIYTREKDVNLAIALKLEQALVRLGYDVLMSRTTDVYPTLDERTTEANQWDADAFICVHANAATTAGARGIEILYKNYEDRSLAEAIYPYLEIVSPWPDRGLVYRDGLRVLNSSTMPAVIIEYGFITNSTEESYLNRPDYQTSLAEQTCAGISSWFGVPLSP